MEANRNAALCTGHLVMEVSGECSYPRVLYTLRVMREQAWAKQKEPGRSLRTLVPVIPMAAVSKQHKASCPCPSTKLQHSMGWAQHTARTASPLTIVFLSGFGVFISLIFHDKYGLHVIRNCWDPLGTKTFVNWMQASDNIFSRSKMVYPRRHGFQFPAALLCMMRIMIYHSFSRSLTNGQLIFGKWHDTIVVLLKRLSGHEGVMQPLGVFDTYI